MFRCYACRVGALVLRAQKAGYRVRCTNDKCTCGVVFKNTVREIKLSGQTCSRCSGTPHTPSPP